MIANRLLDQSLPKVNSGTIRCQFRSRRCQLVNLGSGPGPLCSDHPPKERPIDVTWRPPSLPSHRVSLCGQMSGKCRWLGRCSQRDGPDGSSRGVAPLSRCQSRPSTDGRLQELFSSRGAFIQSESHLFSDGFTIDDSFIVLGFVYQVQCIL